MERMWSPWRSHYVETSDEANAQGCFLCNCARGGSMDQHDLVVARYDHCFVVLNRYPYNAGHLLIAPNDHAADLRDLPDAVGHEMLMATRESMAVLDDAIGPHAYNFGANLGRSAGAGVPDHLHWHLVPRWDGDTNFMPTIAETKVMSHALEDLWKQFVEGFKRRTSA